MIAVIRTRSDWARRRVLSTTGEAETAGQSWFMTVGDRELERAYRLAGFILGDARDAEDATQDALARAWTQRHQLRSLDHAQAWFDRILVNTCRYRLRRRRSGVRWLAIDPGALTAPRDAFAETIARDAVLRGLDALDPDHRIVVVLRYWADVPLEGIARRLDIPLGTVKSRLHYALRDMRAAVRDPQPSDPLSR
jgi:RNA polymerase sigma-70 factor (ECF subfamily)